MRQFVSSRMPDNKGRIVLSVKEYRYLSRVLRLPEGSSIDVSLPGGGLIQMKFYAGKTEGFLKAETGFRNTEHKTKKGGQINFNNACGGQAENEEKHTAPAFWLFQFLPKVQKTDLIVRQAAECGVRRIVPIRGEYSPPYTPRIDRWQRIIREARQQSGSPVETEITEALSVREAATLWQKTASNLPAAAFILCEREENQDSLFTHIRRAVEKAKQNTEKPDFAANDPDRFPLLFTAFAAGCEGGISPTERNLLEQSGFVPIHLKTNILRAETAALYGLAALQSAVTEYREWKPKE